MSGAARRELAAPTPAERAALLQRLGDAAAHAAALDELSCLNEVETAAPPAATAAPAPRELRVAAPRELRVAAPRELRVAAPRELRVAAWNAERGTWLDDAVPLLTALDADVLLLSELDVGMARSGQRHVARELAAALGHGYAFGVEFVELGLGGRVERERHAGEDNEAGLHGNAVLSRAGFDRPALFRFDRSGVWFTDERGEPRVGGRCAVAASVAWPHGGALAVVATHLESHGDPEQRAGQVRALLEAVDEYTGGGPAVVAGDLNTFSAPAVEIYASRLRRALLERSGDPGRFDDPVRYEPLFAVAADHGFSWGEANVMAPTQRTRRDGSPRPPLMHLDWILVRGVTATAPRIVPAVDGEGRALSDHEIVVTTLTPVL